MMERYLKKLPKEVDTDKPISSEGISEPVPKDLSSGSLKDVSDIPAKKLKRIEDDKFKNPIPSTSASSSLPLSIEEEELDLHLEEIGNAGENVKSSVSKGALPKSKRPPNKFVNSWLQIPEFKGWLEKSKQMKGDNEQGYCKLYFCNLVAHKVDFQRHAKSEKHKSTFSQISGSKSIDSMMKNSLSTNVKRAEIKLAGLIACNNLPFSLMDTLVPLIGNICPDSEIAQSMKSKRKKTTAILKESLGNSYRQKLNTTLAKPGCFLSIIMDETTDRGSVKQCAFTVIYYDEQRGSPKCKFFDIDETPSGTAVDLTNCLKETFSKHQVPLENLVGFSSDTTNVMFGENHSVVSLLKSEFPNVVFVKCSCHMVHLVASKACLKLPRSLEDLLRNVVAHFSRSYSRQVAFKEFQEFFQVEMLKILSPSTTRWLSLSACVNRVLCQYTALQHYFRETCFEDPSKTLDDIAATLANVFTIVYLEFLSYALGLLTDFNEMFQSEHPLLHKLNLRS